MHHDITIIGAGPAGIAAGIQLMRYGIKPLIIEQAEPAGLLGNAGWIENYPGFPNGIQGPDLKKLFQQQFNSYEPDLVRARVRKLDFFQERELFFIETDDAGFQSRLVVIASGSRAKKPSEIDSWPDELQQCIFYEIAPLLQEKKKKMIVLGSGDIALDYALNLGRDHQVVLFCRGSLFKALPLLQKRVGLQANIQVLYHARLGQATQGRERALAVSIDHNGCPVRLEADYLVCAIGREADKTFYASGLLELEDSLIQQEKLFLIGDVRNGSFRQIAIAAGDGLKAAMRIAEILTVS
jgi:thioredoxin reductase